MRAMKRVREINGERTSDKEGERAYATKFFFPSRARERERREERGRNLHMHARMCEKMRESSGREGT